MHPCSSRAARLQKVEVEGPKKYFSCPWQDILQHKNWAQLFAQGANLAIGSKLVEINQIRGRAGKSIFSILL